MGENFLKYLNEMKPKNGDGALHDTLFKLWCTSPAIKESVVVHLSQKLKGLLKGPSTKHTTGHSLHN